MFLGGKWISQDVDLPCIVVLLWDVVLSVLKPVHDGGGDHARSGCITDDG